MVPSKTSDKWWFVSKVSMAVAFGVVLYLIEHFNWNQGRYRALMLVLVLIATPILMRLSRGAPVSTPVVLSRVLIVACAIALCLHLIHFIEFFHRPHLFDIATTTISAGEAMLSGKNPYRLPIDPHPEFSLGSSFNGYKYLPMMAVTYLPLSALLGERGILITNLLLDLAVVWLVFQLSCRMGTQTSGLWAAFLYLMPLLVPRQLFHKGVTDLAAVVPLLVALLYLERKPGLAGLYVGLSISTKFLPGALFVPCCLPQRSPLELRWWYAAGVALGLVPTLVFLVWSPVELFSNTVLFNAQRPIDSTSWLYEMPSFISLIVRASFAVVVVSVAAYVWFNRPTVAIRCGLSTICVLGTILSGPTVHSNYQLWWLPMFAVLLGAAAFGRQAQKEKA